MSGEAKEIPSHKQYASALRDMARRYEQVVREVSILTQLDELDTPELDFETICQRVVETIAFELTAENCSLMMFDGEREFLELRAACSPLETSGAVFRPGDWDGKRFRRGEGVMGRVAEQGVPARIVDVAREPDFLPATHPTVAIGSLMCFPLRSSGETIGVLNLSHPRTGFFSVESERTMALVADRVARILTNRRLHEQLQASEARLRLVTENAGDGLVAFDERLRIFSANPAVEAITGIPAPRFLTGEVDWLEVVHPDDRERVREEIQRTRETDRPIVLEYRCLDADGVVHELEQRNTPMHDGDGRVSGVVAILQDVTRRNRAERERQLLATAIEQSDESVVITDTEGRIQYVNPAAERVTLYTREALINERPSLLKSGHHDEAFYMSMWQTIARGEVWRGRFVNKRRNGEIYQEETVISPVRNEAGEISNYVAVKRDVTQQLKMEDQLRQSQKLEAIGQLAGGVAHDFNNLLTGIMGNVSLARRHAEGTVLSKLEAAEKACFRAAALVKQLLTFSRKSPVVLKPIPLDPIVQEVVEIARTTFDRRIEVDYTPPRKSHGIRGDSGQIHQVLLNLCLNARDALEAVKGGAADRPLRVLIRTSRVAVDDRYCEQYTFASKGDYVRVSVADNGIGMDEEVRKHIFEPFYTTKEKGRGTGLGLATVYGIVKQHGGWVTVASVPDQGTCFELYFPAVAREFDAFESNRPETSGHGAETILVVDDEEMVVDLAEAILEPLGYTVLKAEDGPRAIEIYRKQGHEIDLVVLDLSMPRMSGWQVLDELRTLNTDVRAIISSGYMVQHDPIDLDSAGIYGFVAKPYRAGDLVSIIREALDRR